MTPPALEAADRVRDRLAGAPALADLPTDRPRPARPSRAEAACTRPAPRTDSLVAAVCALLHRYTGQDDVLVALADGETGTAAVVRSRAADDPSWREIAAAVAADVAAARNEPPVPIDAIAPAARGADAELPGVHVAIGAGARPSDGFDLALVPCADGASIEWRWASDVLDPDTVQRMAAHLDRLTAAVATDPDIALSRIPLLSADERRRLIVEWNATTVPFSDGVCLHDLVLATAAHTADATAAIGEDGSELPYAELASRAHQLARYLGTIGVERGALVGVHLERSLDMLVALLAVLEAGAAYVPLDPSFPPDRLALMVEDSGLTTLVTHRALAHALPVPNHVRRVVVDGDDAGAIAATPAIRPDVTVDARDLAYVIYTSGSTGRPKGVMLEHRSVVNFLESMAREPGLAATDRLLAVTTLSFDIAGLELWLPLLVGGTVVIASRATAADPQALAAALIEHRISVMQATPATWRMLVEAGWPGDPALRVLCGGEALPAALAGALVERAGEVWNLYGPTETTIWSTVQRVVPGAPVSIGGPIANTTLYVLDPAMEPVPIGVAGELYIGGDGLARGYHGRPDLTTERFVDDPFDHAPGARLYRTGDLVRYRPDGRIEFLGRIDQQVKVRGFRIELGEIETVLGRNVAVEEAVVITRDDPHGDTRLVAYVTTTATHGALTASALRRSVQDVLPHYMVPSVVVFLDGMPRTPNGKTDRTTMPEPDWSLIGRDVPYVAPRDELEARMAALWERQIGRDGIGVDDDFFELGVESIVAARLFATIEREFGVELPIGTVFANPTVAQLAALVRGGCDNEAAPRWPSLVPIARDGDQVPVFGVHGGAGTVLLYSELARRLAAAGHPFYGLAAQGLYTRAPVHRSVQEMAVAYLGQVRDVQPHGPYVFVGYCFGAHVALEMARRARAAGDGVALVVVINGPSKGYVTRHRGPGQEHDDEHEDEGAPVTAAPAATSRPADRLARARSQLRLIVRRAQLRAVMTLRRPLPNGLRQDRWMAWIAHFAELHYRPTRYDGTVAVFRVAALYDEPDLGWHEVVGGRLECFDVPGDQPNRRWTMKEPAVGFVARDILTLLAELAPDYNAR